MTAVPATAAASATPVVITGLALRLPGAATQDDFWQLLIDGVVRTAPVSARRRALARAPWWDDVIGEVEGIELFDAGFFGIDEHEARFMDPQHRVGMEVAYDALCDAGLAESGVSDSRRYSVHMAMTGNPYYGLVCRYLDEHGPAGLPPRTIMNTYHGALAARISHQFDLTGPVMAVDTACSSFLSALVQGIDSIRNGGCDGAVVGGVNLLSAAYTTMLCNAGGITTSHPHTRVFDEEADGTLIGEGVVVVVLERQDVARARNRRIYGRIAAHAINNDGSSLSIMAPNPRGQGAVIRDAYADGVVDPTAVGYIETHGAGTRVGDPIEVNALSKVYRKEDFGDAKIGLGSVKSNIGHLLSAAGGAGLAKLLLSLRNGQMAPNVHLTTINPLLRLERTPFEVMTSPRPWPRVDGRPRVGAITSLGLGGTNVHVVVEEADDGGRPRGALPEPVVCLSATSQDALRQMLTEVERHTAGGADPYDLAMTLARFRPAYAWRATAVLDPATGAVTQTRMNHVAKPDRRPKGEPPRTLEAAAERFLHGGAIDWTEFFPDGTGTTLRLDPYPFSRLPYWLDADPPKGTDMTKDEIKAVLIKGIASELSIAPGDVGDDEGFAQLGVSSVQALKIVNRLRKELDMDINPVALFEFKTVDDISAYLAEERAA
ncbi:beta-ketoacyl synthase N-terminal-like domain-containing protein [Cellulomonas sp. S1-8]|uniref:beta-ketoacyl synthase N-terminal-like domain-containing protein n=1 Tax=Cellulomonas sp. S1-8 TaxID=2904790 RepID=UPI0022448522|nr:beta-ketoacyl synthase N-terminal-like domain-containing protein [Cellulomonas sp. S1-8]UZN02617.1 beta-ketoacyl synthase N-terminal-like domain-containing protein [Cellulomonas sp. S1-8]